MAWIWIQIIFKGQFIWIFEYLNIRAHHCGVKPSSYLEIFQKGVGSPYSKLVEELLCLSLNIFQKGGGVSHSKKFEELFCLSLEIFQEGGVPDCKDDKELFLHCLRYSQRKMWEDEQNTDTLRNFNPYKTRIPKIQGGGQGRLAKIQTEADFFFRRLLLKRIKSMGQLCPIIRRPGVAGAVLQSSS